MNATDGQLEGSSESCELWGWRCGALVVAGVVAEFVIAGLNPPYGSFWERWGSASAGALVALGVAGEVMFGRIAHSRQKELTRRSDRKLAEAVERLAEVEFAAGFTEEKLERAINDLAQAQRDLAAANERAKHAELSVLRLSNPRIPDKDAFLAALKGKPLPTYVDVMYSRDGADCSTLAALITSFLREAGWPVRQLGPAVIMPTVMHVNPAEWAGGQPWGVTILEPGLGKTYGPGHALLHALADAMRGERMAGAGTNTIPEGAVRVIVAPRP